MQIFAKMVHALSRRGGNSRRLPARTLFRLRPLEARDVPSAYGDFNGDGYDDLAVGVPGEDYSSYALDTGAVNVIYGSSGGLAAAGYQPNQLWTQDSYGIQDSPNAHDRFGAALAVGNFNGDAYDDLAIGVPGEDGSAGAVNVIYGSPLGLRWNFYINNQFWQQGAASLVDAAETGDQFGAVLTAGDFNGDGSDDLAVGVPGEDVGTVFDAGAVQVLYGSVYGLTSTSDQLWTQDSPGVPGVAQLLDRFGSALAAGDFNGDGEDDLAVGAPEESDEDGANEASVGAVFVIHGAHGPVPYGGGLSTTLLPAQSWSQDDAGIEGTEEAYDNFGSALAAGDFNGDYRDDLAVGVPGEDVGTAADAGAVNVIYGTASGLTSAGSQLWHQDQESIDGVAASFDNFGWSVAAGDFNGDGLADLAVGVPYDDLPGIRGQGWVYDAGAVNVIYGSYGGLSATTYADQYWQQNVAGVEDTVEAADNFGYAVAVGDFNGDGSDDLAIGVPGEDVSGVQDAGAVNVLYGSGLGGLTSNLDQFWHQDSPGIEGAIWAGDGFGYSLGRRK